MLDYLLDYTEFHFDAEEKLQEEISFPAINEHKAKHAEFKNAVKELQEMLEEEEGPTEAFVAQVQKNVVDWLKNAVKELQEMLEEEEGPTEAFVAQVQKNVVDWLFDHIKVFDRAVAEYKG